MPRGDGTGPRGTGPLGRGQGRCQQMGFNNITNASRNKQGRTDMTNNTSANPEDLEAQARQLEEQAANLRNLAKQRNPK